MSKRSQCDEARFLKDVATHEMQIVRDDGVQRHLRFKTPGTSCYYFDIVTWSGHLCYTGDMGTFVFSRIEDMFGFFRMDDHDWNKNPNGLSIYPGYWSEKLIAVAREGYEAWDEDEFVRRVNDVRVGWMRWAKSLGISKDDRRELWEDVEHDVLSEPSNEHLCVAQAHRRGDVRVRGLLRRQLQPIHVPLSLVLLRTGMGDPHVRQVKGE